MKSTKTNSQQNIQNDLLRRIHSGEWRPGALIPTEVSLAQEIGCARTTVNRALQKLADDGHVVRKRRSGTRVALSPVRKATMEIPIVRDEIESKGGTYKFMLLLSEKKKPPLWVQVRLGVPDDQEMVHLQSLHISDKHPYMFEDRWVSIKAVPEITSAPLGKISPNEWLVREVPYSRGEISFSSCSADETVANIMETTPGSAMFLVERSTWIYQTPITTLKMYYPEGFRLITKL